MNCLSDTAFLPGTLDEAATVTLLSELWTVTL